MYTTSWCGDCIRIKNWLAEEDYKPETDFTEINIEQDPQAASKVEQINNGNRSVPTLVFSDDTTLTEPTIQELKTKLAKLTLAR